MNPSRFVRIGVSLAILIAIAATMVATNPIPTRAAAQTVPALEFRNTMHKLWEDHVLWTRLYIISAVSGLPDKDMVAQRLLANQVDIGNAIKPFYGDEAGNQLTALLKEHILGAVDLVAAAQANNQVKVKAANEKWTANADQIASFLSEANAKNWPLDAVKAEMHMHLALTLEEAQDRLKGDYAADVKDFDKVHEHILGMADILSDGIVKQFPDRFDQNTIAEFPLRSTMRKLWADHVMWTYLYIVSTAANLPDKDLVAQRLLANQVDIGNAIKPFYGDEAGNQLTALLKEHIAGAVDVLAAAMANDQSRLEAANKKWYANADQIASFLSDANAKNWPLQDMKAAMEMHLGLTLKEAQSRLKGDFAANIKDFDAVFNHILTMADVLSTGIIQQFPDKAVPAAGKGSTTY